MRHLERRQIVLLGIVGALIVAFLLWKVVLSGSGGDNNTVQPAATVTTVANAQTQSEGGATSSPQSSAGSSTGASGSTPVVDVPFDPNAYRDPFAPAG